jgi:uncharacterized membrane protein YphA (DoxX/SURF4 family)
MSRHYPGFLAAFFIVLLRIAIGWHFLYEGVEKLESTLTGKDRFSAEIYLRNATGPLAPYYRGMLPDVNGLAVLDQAKLKASWSDDVTRIADHFGFTQDQRSQAEKILGENLQWADYWFNDPENSDKRQKYLHDLASVQKVERDPNALAYQRERAWEGRRLLDVDRRALVQPLLERGKHLRDSVAEVVVRASPDQRKAGAPPAVYTSLDLLNDLTMYGLIAIGFCLLAGLLTPLAALSAAAFLAMIYFSMPPWPGMPPNPKAEGHYLYVSKNLVELLACMVIATTPSGHWIGLDALFFGARRRRRLARAAQARGEGSARPETPPTREETGRGRQRELDRDAESKPIPLG